MWLFPKTAQVMCVYLHTPTLPLSCFTGDVIWHSGLGVFLCPVHMEIVNILIHHGLHLMPTVSLDHLVHVCLHHLLLPLHPLTHLFSLPMSTPFPMPRHALLVIWGALPHLMHLYRSLHLTLLIVCCPARTRVCPQTP